MYFYIKYEFKRVQAGKASLFVERFGSYL